MTLLSIDPGTAETGVALWTGDTLVSARLLKVGVTALPAWLAMAKRIAADFRGAVTEVVIERPQIYPSGRSKGNPNDLLPLAFLVGAACSELASATIYMVKPREWNNGQPKEVTEKRVLKRLSEQEKISITLPAKSYQHNVYDAIGIGLHHLKRRLA